MKLTKSKLRELIREELESLHEDLPDYMSNIKDSVDDLQKAVDKGSLGDITKAMKELNRWYEKQIKFKRNRYRF